MSNIKITGIDVSAHQPNIDWKRVKEDGVEFAIIKATQGRDAAYPNGFADSSFEKHYAGAKAAGIKVGAYHFAVFVTENQAREEARQFMSALKGKKFDYPLCLDLEDLPAGRVPEISLMLTKKQLTDYSIIFMEELKKAGYTPMLYINTDWRRNKLDYARLSNYLLWQAHYPFGYSYKPMDILYNGRPPAIDEKVAVWQCTGVGRVSGISGNVDMNWGFIDLDANQKTASDAPAVPKIGDPLGDVLYSDIVVYINGRPIPSSISDNKTLVIAEDLANYGFDVKWDGTERTLKIGRNKNKPFNPLPVEKMPAGKKSGDFKCKYVYTDVKTYLDGELVGSYAIGGRTLIDVELLAKPGGVYWYGKERKLLVEIN